MCADGLVRQANATIFIARAIVFIDRPYLVRPVHFYPHPLCFAARRGRLYKSAGRP
jgi:hypothetical protein